MKKLLLFLTFGFFSIGLIFTQDPIIYLDFNEGSGTSVTNKGTRGGTGNFSTETPAPAWSTNIPTGDFSPVNNTTSLDLHTNDNTGYILFDVTDGLGTEGLEEFTITGWINVPSTDMGEGGNRIISTWLGGERSFDEPVPIDYDGDSYKGVDLVVHTEAPNGTRLSLGVNSAGDYPACCSPISADNTVTINASADVSNWLFFAVTYKDPNVAYYFGNGSTEAAIDALGEQEMKPYTLDAFPGLVKATGGVCAIGQFTPSAQGIHGTDRAFYGLMDEIKVFGVALTLEQIKVEQTSGGTSVRNIQTSAFELYPNPAKGVLYISNFENIKEIFISNIIGEKVRSFKPSGNSIDLSGLHQGVYIIGIIDKSNMQYSQWLIIE